MSTWWSQKFAAEGAATAEGISRQLGKPHLEPLTILVRESAQNSWDAKESDAVRFSISLRRLGERAEDWRSVLGSGLPPEASIDLHGALAPENLVAIISDRGTRGLGGPVRADVMPDPGEDPDFVQFLRNVGESRDRDGGGGTYGFGKGILYATSGIGAILVDTHARHGGSTPRRLMGAALGTSFHAEDGTRYTGRHWWGAVKEGIPDPLIAAEADSLSERLGLPGFSPGEFGTDIAILDFQAGRSPDAGDDSPRTLQEAGEFLASSILWHLWPKLGSKERPALMKFKVDVEGEEIPIPDPVDVPILRPFVLALDAIHRGDGVPYKRTVDPKFAGSTFAHAVPLKMLDRDSFDPIVDAAMPLDETYRHVCRMRSPELVVDYMPHEPHPSSDMGYAGVFLASLEADEYFAMSEPPTHDDWVLSGLSGTASGVVRGAKGAIGAAVQEALPPVNPNASVSVEGVGRVSNAMSSLIPAVPGAGASLPGLQGGGSARGGKAAKRGGKARVIDGPRVQIDETGVYIHATVETPSAPAAGLKITAHVSVVLSGGLESPGNTPLASEVPEVRTWTSRTTGHVHHGSTIVVAASSAQDVYDLRISHAPDVMTRLRVETESVDG